MGLPKPLDSVSGNLLSAEIDTISAGSAPEADELLVGTVTSRDADARHAVEESIKERLGVMFDQIEMLNLSQADADSWKQFSGRDLQSTQRKQKQGPVASVFGPR